MLSAHVVSFGSGLHACLGPKNNSEFSASQHSWLQRREQGSFHRQSAYRLVYQLLRKSRSVSLSDKTLLNYLESLYRRSSDRYSLSSRTHQSDLLMASLILIVSAGLLSSAIGPCLLLASQAKKRQSLES